MASTNLSAPVPTGQALSQNPPRLFTPLKIRSVEFQNRIWVSPMGQYSARDGLLEDFHLMHIGGFAFRGPSLTIVEATAVAPEGRISSHDAGLWNEEQAKSLARITTFVHQQNQKIGIQLNHAGRKSSTHSPWNRRGKFGKKASAEEGGWPEKVYGPSEIAWDEHHHTPVTISEEQIKRITQEFAQAAKRAVDAGIDVIEIHGAHGYLLSSFLSATSNKRQDRYGGSLENRMRFSLEVVEAVRSVMPSGMPLIFRVTATEWIPNNNEQFNVSQTIVLAKELYKRGVDILTVSSGGNSSLQKPPHAIGYQVDIAREVRSALEKDKYPLLVAAVGRIEEPKMAEALLSSGADDEHRDAAGDVVLIGRQFLRDPNWVLRAAHELNVEVKWPEQYSAGRWPQSDTL